MPDIDLTLRGILAAQAFVALFGTAWFFGTIWPERGWAIRTVVGGLIGVLIYVFAGQIKAYNLNIPVDGFTYLGMFAYTVLLTGLLWFLCEHHERRGR